MKKWIYVAGILALGFVIFNNIVQTVEAIRLNSDYLIGLFLAMIGSIFYGIVNIKNQEVKWEKYMYVKELEGYRKRKLKEKSVNP